MRRSRTKHKQNLKGVNYTGALAIGVVVFMLCLSFASVPLYRIFCQKTGYGGTPKIVSDFNFQKTNREFIVQFNADVNRGLPWRFKPSQHEIKVTAGEPALAFYRVKNLSDIPLVGIASYNVTPDKIAPYFSKIKCFCFEEQRINPGEEVDMPVQFYIDPDVIKETDLKDIKVMTLSYTFFEAKDFKGQKP